MRKLLAIGFIVALMIGAALPGAALAHRGGDNQNPDAPGCSNWRQRVATAAQNNQGVGQFVRIRAQAGVRDNVVARAHGFRCQGVPRPPDP